MPETKPDIIRLSDYRAPDYRTQSVDLTISLAPNATIVTANLQIERAGQAPSNAPLILYGESMELLSVKLDNRELDPDDYDLTEQGLHLKPQQEAFHLVIQNRIDPESNKALEGLYLSNGIFCTQCEPEGFRRITYFQDKPDIMARYRVRVEGDVQSCPIMLSNGNLIDSGVLPGGRHFAQWEDPFPKPSYLFALVAGDLAKLEDQFTTRSGRQVSLRIYSEHRNISQCYHAMDALKRSMRWDEDVYGLEYDLDLYQIVAVEDFNMGAMENKGLNIFNTSATLAHPEHATDNDFVQVERIIAHEYFHNWTGNRVTCRDWFQLTLKEGLTVFRDQQFGADVHSEATTRISTVAQLREGQFPEDAGPLAHPIRPDSYIEINNFYTRTVYSKGAEIIRMVHTMLGPERFRKGMDLYFDRHDGQAVTCEDFVVAMADASGLEFSDFMNWYNQAGTPEVTIDRDYNVERGTLKLTLKQHTKPTPGQETKLPLPMPLRLGFIGKSSGKPLPLRIVGENIAGEAERIIPFNKAQQTFEFESVGEEPVPSLFRGFSAPIKLKYDLSTDELGILLVHDNDPFNKWDAGQRLFLKCLTNLYGSPADQESAQSVATTVAAVRSLLVSAEQEPALTARAVTLPSRRYFAEQLDLVSVDNVDQSFRSLRQAIGRELASEWMDVYSKLSEAKDYELSPGAIGKRALKNISLRNLAWGKNVSSLDLAHHQYDNANNMTDRLSALSVIADHDTSRRDKVMEAFYQRWADAPLVIDKWFAVMAMIEDRQSVERVRYLLKHPGFNSNNPNRVRALVGTFAAANMTGFHRPDGAGYALLANLVTKIDRRNPQLAAKLVIPLGHWHRYPSPRSELMQSELKSLAESPLLSRDCFEIVSKSLGTA